MRIINAVFALVLLSACQSGTQNEQTSTSDSTAKDTTAMNTPATPQDNVLSSQEQSEGWVLLFDGTTKNGWHVYNKVSDGSAWKVSDGALHLDPQQKKDWQTVGGGDIVTDGEYDNYHFQADWKLDTGGNSGIMFYVKEEPKYEYAWYTGPEMQVLDNERHPDSKIVKHRAGDLYDLITSKPETVKPAGEWNHVDIVANNGKLELSLNGTKVVETTLWDDNWKKMVAGSKFAKMKGFGTFKSGRFALQDHGFPVWFKNIKIRKL
jgi:hypothetical protein